MSSRLLQPAVLHLSFKVTWTCLSLSKSNLLLDPRTDLWGQGTFTPLVLRRYRRAISLTAELMVSALEFLIKFIQQDV